MASMKPRVQIVAQSPFGEGRGNPETPSRNHGTSRSLGINMAQKQALIDNLQLEITERARKLRAQYALQAQGLRSRIEIRVNRIPVSLRSVTMGELLAKFESQDPRHDKDPAAAGIAPKPALRSELPSTSVRPAQPVSELGDERMVLPKTRGTKRPRTEMDSAPGQENAPPVDLPNPKKRAKVAIAAAQPKNRATSRAKAQPSQVLSPKSSNSCTLPQSPARAGGKAAKAATIRPISPLKAATAAPILSATGTLADMVEQTKVTRAASGKSTKGTGKTAASTEISGRSRAMMPPPPPAPAAKRGTATTQRMVSNTSTTSTATTGTVITKGRGRPKAKATTATSAATTTATAREKKAATKTTETAAAAAPRRTLRKRL